MKKLILLRGIPGSGKSTESKSIISQSLAESKSCESFSADEFFMQPDGNGGSKYVYDGNLIGKAHESCKLRSWDAMDRGVDVVIIDNTCLVAWDAGPYVYYALELGTYEVEFREPSSPQWKAFVEHWARMRGQIKLEDPIVDKFAALNTHDVPRHSIAKMMRKWQPVITLDEALSEYLK